MKKWKRILSAALSVLLLSGNISVYAAENLSAARTYTDRSEVIGTAVVVGDEESAGGSALFSRPGTIATITPGKPHSYGSWGTCEFNVKTETGNHLGFCAEPNSGTPSGNFSVSILDDSQEKNANIKAAVLCYVIPELYEGLGKNIYNAKDNNTYAYCHALIGYLYNGSLTGLSSSMADGVRMMYSTINTHRQTNQTLISYMQRYQVYVAYNDQQDIVWVEEQQKGSMNLKKESANPEMTNENSCYSLEGTVYGVYKEQSCNTKIADLTTDAQGNSNTIEVDAGTYYVKETKAPKGFVLDKKVHPVTVTAGKTAVLKVKDLPQLDPVGVLLIFLRKPCTVEQDHIKHFGSFVYFHVQKKTGKDHIRWQACVCCQKVRHVFTSNHNGLFSKEIPVYITIRLFFFRSWKGHPDGGFPFQHACSQPGQKNRQ